MTRWRELKLPGDFKVFRLNKKSFRYAHMKVHQGLCTLSAPTMVCDKFGSMKMSIVPGDTSILLGIEVMVRLEVLMNYGTGECMFLKLNRTR